MSYGNKSYGRNQEVEEIYRLFKNGKDLSMPGPRRLGKTFQLERLVDKATAHGWTSIKVEVAGCTDTRSFYRELCEGIGAESSLKSFFYTLVQRANQIVNPRVDPTGSWQQSLLQLDYESYFESLLVRMHRSRNRRWALLIDELPIFLKALHDKGPQGVDAARAFMNQISRLRVKYPKIRWLITGSIGLEPLGQAGNYMGVLAKFQAYKLNPLNPVQARDFVCDLATEGRLINRQKITEVEADAIVRATGWLSPFYLEALAIKLHGDPTTNAPVAAQLVEQALSRLLDPTEIPVFAVWEEHLRKHYSHHEQAIAFPLLRALASAPQGQELSNLPSAFPNHSGGPILDSIRPVLMRLETEGFVVVDDWSTDDPNIQFSNILLRRWWARYTPQLTK